jgi:hypothetical protein
MRYFEVMVTVRGKAFCYVAHAPSEHEARRLTAEKHGCPLGATYVIYRGSALVGATAGAHFIERLPRLSGRSGDDSTSHASTTVTQRSPVAGRRAQARRYFHDVGGEGRPQNRASWESFATSWASHCETGKKSARCPSHSLLIGRAYSDHRSERHSQGTRREGGQLLADKS